MENRRYNSIQSHLYLHAYNNNNLHEWKNLIDIMFAKLIDLLLRQDFGDVDNFPPSNKTILSRGGIRDFSAKSSSFLSSRYKRLNIRDSKAQERQNRAPCDAFVSSQS